MPGEVAGTGACWRGTVAMATKNVQNFENESEPNAASTRSSASRVRPRSGARNPTGKSS